MKNKSWAIASLALAIAGSLPAHAHEPEPENIPTPPYAQNLPETPYEAPEGTWTLVVMPDTQYYAKSYPEVFLRQTEWLAANKDKRNILFVTQVGDITNNNVPKQWEVARSAFDLLNKARLPYLLVPGNHDTGTQHSGETKDRWTLMNRYFTPKDYAGSDAAGYFKSGEMENTWREFNTPAGKFLVVGLEFIPRDEVLEWANQVVAKHPDHKVIVVTHSYLNHDDTLLPTPTKYPVASKTTVNGGQDVWDKFVSKHPNILFVLSGHIVKDGTGYLPAKGAGGQTVHQILANYQAPKERLTGSGVVEPHRGYGGGGYLRLMEFLPDGKTVKVKSYSPWYDKWLTEPDQQFDLELKDFPTKPSP